jgi:hypothetical protein
LNELLNSFSLPPDIILGIDNPIKKLKDLKVVKESPYLPQNLLNHKVNALLKGIQKNDKKKSLEFLYNEIPKDHIDPEIWITDFNMKASPFFLNRIDFMNKAQELKHQIRIKRTTKPTSDYNFFLIFLIIKTIFFILNV